MSTWPLKLRAAWRLARAALHVLRGLFTVSLVLPRLGAAARERAIRRWAEGMFAALGIRFDVSCSHGLTRGGQLFVANHVSWLDIVALLALEPRLRFVAMAELRQWRGVARLADAARTIYLKRRSGRDLLRVRREVETALAWGDAVAVFPEGIVGDGRALLPFHGNLLQAAIDTGTAVRPLALRYDDAGGAASAAPLFTGNITLVQSLWRLASAEGLTLRLQRLPPRFAVDGAMRRDWARALRSDIERALQALPAPSARQHDLLRPLAALPLP